MEIQYFGANNLKITTKKATFMTDPKSDIADVKVDLKKIDYVLATQPQFLPTTPYEGFIVEGPGEYEFSDSSVKGISAQPHTGTSGDKSATMYRVIVADITILITGHIDSKLSESQLEEIGTVDILIVPVGGSGYTSDAVSAANIVRFIEPKLVIPVHYNDGLKYEVPQQPLEDFVKELSVQVEEPLEKYKFKSLPEQLTIQPLKRS